LYIDTAFYHTGASVKDLVLTSPLPAGSHTLSVQVENPTTGLAGMPDTFDLNINQVAITGVTDNYAEAGSAIGLVANGDSTDDLTPTISGTLLTPLGAGETIVVYADDGRGSGPVEVGTATPAGTTWSVTPSTNVEVGTLSLTASIVLVEDNGSGGTTTTVLVTSEETYSITTIVAPTAPTQAVTITSVTDNTGDNAGSTLTSGASTDETAPVLEGTLDGALGTDEVLAVYAGNTRLGEAVVDDSNLNNITWTFDPNPTYSRATKVNITDGVITSASAGWGTSSLFSNEYLAGDGVFSFINSSGTGTYRIVGLSANLNGEGSDDNYATIDYGLFLHADGRVFAYENGDAHTEATEYYQIGDQFAIERLGDTIHYLKNGSVFYTSAFKTTAPLYIDTSFRDSGSVIEDLLLTIPLPAGSHTLSVQVENPTTGLAGTPDTFDLNVNQVVITGMTDNFGTMIGPVADGGSTDDLTPTISGSLSVPLATGETVKVYDGITELGTALIAANGTDWSFTPTSDLNAATLNLTASIVSGGSAVVTSDAYSITTMTAATPPTQTVVIAQLADDQGAHTANIINGGSTDDSAPALSGTLSAQLDTGQELTIYDSVNGVSTRLGTAVVNGTLWSFDANLASGTHKLTARVEDVAAGLQGTASSVFTVIVNGISIDNVQDDAGTITGMIASGGVSDDLKPTLSGSLLAPLGDGETVVIYNGTTPLGTATVNGNQWSYTPADNLPVGYYNLTAVIQSGSNQLINSDAFEVDLVSSAAPTQTVTINTVTDDVSVNGSSTGLLVSGASTDDNVLTMNGILSGPLTAGQVLAVYDTVNGVTTQIGTADVNATIWSFTTPELINGGHNLSVRVENTASGTQGTAATHLLQVQTVTLTSISDDVGDITGNLLAQGSTSTDDKKPVLSGTLSTALGNGEELAIYNGTTKLGTAITNGTSWSFTPADSDALAVGDYNFVAVIQATGNTDIAAGRVLSEDVAISIAATATPTQTATIVNVTDDISLNGSSTGLLGSGVSTDDNLLTLEGTLSAVLGSGQVLAVYDTVNGVTTQIGTADVTTTVWSFTTPQLSNGSHSFTVRVVNTATNALGQDSVPHAVQVQTLAITGVSDNAGAMTGNLLAQGSTSTDDLTPTLSGTLSTAPGNGEELAIYNGTTKLGAAIIRGTSWSFTPADSDPLAVADYNFVAVIQATGNSDIAAARVVSEGVAISIAANTTPTQIATIVNVTDDISLNGSSTGLLGSGDSTDDNLLALTGILDAVLETGQVLAVYDTVNGVTTQIGTADVTATVWSFTTPQLSNGSHSFTARVVNTATNTMGTASSAHDVQVQTLAITAVRDDAGDITGNLLAQGSTSTDDLTPTLSGTLSTALRNGEELAIYNGTSKLGTAITNGTSWSFTPADSDPLAVADYNFVAVIQATGNSDIAAARVVSEGVAITIAANTTPTQTATIVNVTDDISLNGSSTGLLGSGDSTDDNLLALTGILDAVLETGQILAIYDTVNGVTTQIGTADVTATVWSFTTPQLSNGSHSFTARVVNTATNTMGTASSAHDVQVQTVNVTAINDDAGEITGNLLALGASITDDASPTLSGTLSAALSATEELAIYNGTTKLGTAITNGTSWSFTPADSDPLTVGDYSFVAVVQAVGNSDIAAGRVLSSALEMTIAGADVPTQTVNILSATDDEAGKGSVQGLVASGSSTDDNSLALTGTLSEVLETGQALAIYDTVNGVTSRIGYADVTGTTWSYDATLAVDSHSLTARVENPAALAHGDFSAVYSVHVQSPSHITVGDDTGVLQGTVEASLGRYVSVDINQVEDYGSIELSEIEVWAYVNGELQNVAPGSQLITYSSQNSSTSTYGLGLSSIEEASALLFDENDSTILKTRNITGLRLQFDLGAEYQIVRVVVNEQGSRLAYSERTVQISSYPLDDPGQILDDPTALSSAQNHRYTNLSYEFVALSATDDNTPTLTGTLGTTLGNGEVLAVYDIQNGVTSRLGVANVNSDSSYSFTPDTALADGEHLLKVRIEDTNGNVLAASGDRLLHIDTSDFSGVSVSITEVVDDAVAPGTLEPLTTGSVTGTVASGSTSDDATPTIKGTIGAPLGSGQVVAIYDNGTYLGDATVDGTNWSYTVPDGKALTFGSHSLTAVIESSNGNSSTPSTAHELIVQAPIGFEVDTVATGQAQYVALYFPDSGRYSLGELEVFSGGVNVAEGLQYFDAAPRNAWQGSGNDFAYGGRLFNATDGALGTNWLSSGNWWNHNAIPGGSWIVYDLGEMTPIDQIKLLNLQAIDTDSVHVLTFVNKPVGELDTSLAAAQAVAVDAYEAVTAGSGAENFAFTSAFATSATPTLSGTLATALGNNEELAVYIDGAEVATVTVNADLSWSYTVPVVSALGEGSHEVVVQVQNQTTGSITNGLVVSLPRTILVSGTPAQTVSIDGMVDDQGADSSATGLLAANSVTDDTTPTLSGSLSAPLVNGQVLQVFDGSGVLLGTAGVTGQSWSFTLPDSLALAVGSHSFTARVINPVSGAQGPVSSAFALTVQQIDIATVTDNEGLMGGDLLSAGSGAQYVRISQSEVVRTFSYYTYPAYTFDIAEVQVWAWVGGVLTNVAEGKTVSSHYSAAAGSSASALTDGSAVSGYEAAFGSYDNWLQIDLGQTYDIARVVVIPRTADGSVYADHVADALVSASATDMSGLSRADILADTSIASQLIEGTPDGAGEAVQLSASFASDDTTPVITGTLGVALTPGQKVVIYDNGVRLGEAVVGTNNIDWTFTVSSNPLSSGSHDLVARLEDSSGNVLATTASGALVLKIDASTPTQTVAILDVSDDVADYSVSGSLTKGISTDDSNLTLSGSVSAPLSGAQVLAVYDGATRLGEATVTDSTWTFNTPELAAGVHSFTARIENPATGDNGSSSANFTVIKQSVSVTEIADNVGTATDLLTSGEAARYVRIDTARTGTSTADLAEVEIWALVNGTLTNVAENATILASSPLSQADAGSLVDGDRATSGAYSGWVQIDLGQAYVIQSVVVVPRAASSDYLAETVDVRISTSLSDLSGLAYGELSNNINITTDTLTGSAAGAEASLTPVDNYRTDDATPTFTGTLGATPASSEVLGVYDGDVRIGQAVVTGTDWSFTPGSDLAAGTHTLRLQVEDAVSGNALSGRASSAVFTITIDAMTPTAITTSIITMTDDVGVDTGSVAPAGLTDDPQPTISASINTTLSANQQVSVYDGTTYLGAASISGTNWSFTPVSPLAAGSHSLTAVVENRATGASGTPSAAITFTVQQVNVLGVEDNVGLLQGNVLEQTFSGTEFSLSNIATQTNDTTLTYNGTLAVALDTGQSLKVYDSGALLGTATVTGTEWSFVAPQASYSSHQLRFQIEADSAPGESLLATELTVNINLDDPAFNLLVRAGQLNMSGIDRSLDLTQVSGLDQIPVNHFNLDNIAGITSGEGTNTLTLNIDDVLLSGTNLFNDDSGYIGLDSEGRSQVLISGDSGTVNVTGSGWTAAGTTTDASGETYVIYNYGTTAQLLIDSDVERAGAVL